LAVKNRTTGWVQYEFEKQEEVSTVEVYGFDDTGIGACRLPKSWRILYRVDGKWEPVRTEQKWGVEKDKFNQVVFETVRTGALRLEVQLPDNFSVGIHEWRVR
jgi:hypothetical protein